MRKIDASEFKEQCLSLLENLSPEGILITKRGKPLAQLVPVSFDCAGLIGSMKGKIKVQGNILSTGIEWDITAPAPAATKTSKPQNSTPGPSEPRRQRR